MTDPLDADALRRLLDEHLSRDRPLRWIGVYLFGSVASGRSRPDSDVDIAFLCDHEIDGYDVFVAAQDLAQDIGRDVDLVDLSKAPTVLRAQVVSGGHRLFSDRPADADAFEMYALSDYARLNEERREVLAAFEEPYR